MIPFLNFPEKSRNMFQRIQKMKKNRVCSVQYVHSKPTILLLTSRGFARKVQTLFLTLKQDEDEEEPSRELVSSRLH